MKIRYRHIEFFHWSKKKKVLFTWWRLLPNGTKAEQFGIWIDWQPLLRITLGPNFTILISYKYFYFRYKKYIKFYKQSWKEHFKKIT